MQVRHANQQALIEEHINAVEVNRVILKRNKSRGPPVCATWVLFQLLKRIERNHFFGAQGKTLYCICSVLSV